MWNMPFKHFNYYASLGVRHLGSISYQHVSGQQGLATHQPNLFAALQDAGVDVFGSRRRRGQLLSGMSSMRLGMYAAPVDDKRSENSMTIDRKLTIAARLVCIGDDILTRYLSACIAD
jgi:hypothetical protein